MNDITKEEVYAVLKELHKKKINITKEKVREALGDRGSYTTLTKHIKSWKNPKKKDVVEEINIFSLAKRIEILEASVVKLIEWHGLIVVEKDKKK